MKAHYRTGPLLGAGGMAEVYLGHVEGAGGFVRPVAIKRVHGACARDRGFVDAFEKEALLVAKLSHPNIVSVIDYQVDEQGLPFLVMEYVEGRDLAALVATGPLPCSVAIFVVAEMLRGLAYAHQLPMSTGLRGIVHRDISPHNVLLSWQGDVKVSDFGIAKAFTTTQGAFSTTVRGKPCYMSPEQIGSEPLDGRSDLFAVGAVLWELLAGKRPFEGVTYSETLARVAYSPIPLLRDEAPQRVGDDLEAVVMKLLERDKNARYATAQEAVADLLRCEAAPKDGVGELVALMQRRLSASGEKEPAPPNALMEQWPGPLAARTATRIPSERRTKTLDVPASAAPQLGGALAATGRISTGPNDATIGRISTGPNDATIAAPVSAAPFPLAAVTVVPFAGPSQAAVEMPRRGTWRRRQRMLALGSAALLCGLVASLALRSNSAQSASGPGQSAAPAAAEAQPEALAGRPQRQETMAPVAAPTPSVADQAPPAAPAAARASAAASPPEHGGASAAVSQPAHGRAERGQRRTIGTSAGASQTEPQPPAPASEPKSTARRRIVEIDLSANGDNAL